MQRAAGSITQMFATSKQSTQLLGRKFSYVLVDLGRQVVLQKASKNQAGQCHHMQAKQEGSHNIRNHAMKINSGGVGLWRRDRLVPPPSMNYEQVRYVHPQ